MTETAADTLSTAVPAGGGACSPPATAARGPGRPRGPLTDDTIRRLALPLFEAGASWRKIGAAIGISAQGARYRLAVLGYDIRAKAPHSPWPYRWSDERVQQLAALANAQGAKHAAEVHGITDNSVHVVLHRHGWRRMWVPPA